MNNVVTHLIEGKNAQDKSGKWEVAADSEEEALEIAKARGIQAKSINGEKVKRAKPKL